MPKPKTSFSQIAHLAFAGFALLGCSAKDAVSVSGDVTSPELSVTSSALAASLSGGFDVELRLGSDAPGSAEVTLMSLALERGQTELHAPLLAAPATPFPLQLAVGARVTDH